MQTKELTNLNELNILKKNGSYCKILPPLVGSLDLLSFHSQALKKKLEILETHMTMTTGTGNYNIIHYS